jgi:citrate synthase
VFTYDPGFTSTASCDSTITFIDGDKGELLHRGYPIDQLARNRITSRSATCCFTANCRRPRSWRISKPRDQSHDAARADGELLPRLPPGRASDGDHGGRGRRDVGLLPRLTDIHDPWQREVASIRLIAKMPTIAAWAYKYSIGQPFVYPRNDLDYASNFLRMCFAVPAEDYEVNPILSRAMDRIFTLHADHEQNASTSTVRLASSRAPTRSPASRPASPASGGRRMAAPTRPASRCCARSARPTASPNTSRAPRTRTIRSA